jgi:type IV pilus assembly protein PilO
MKNLNLNMIYDWPIGARAGVLGMVFLIVFMLGQYWKISPLKTNYQDLISQEADLKQQFQLAVVRKDVLTDEMVEYPSLQSILMSWRKQLPLDVDLPELLNQILKMGASHHVFFSMFDPGVETKLNPYWNVPIKMIVVGSYDQVALFLSQLANLSWILSIGDFTFSDENKNDVLGAKLAALANEQNLLTATINFNIYFIPNNQPIVMPIDNSTAKTTNKTTGGPTNGK